MMIINQDVYEKIEKYTKSKYNGIFKDDGWLNDEEPSYLISDEANLNMIEDLIYEIEHWKEQYEDLKQEIEENYQQKPFNPYEEYGISESDFH